jgi:hypothetical protein
MLAVSLILAAQICGSVSVSNQPVSGAIVYLGGGNGRSAPSNVVLSVRDGVLEPRVQVAMRGAKLVLRNSDPTLRVVDVEALSTTNAVRLWRQAMPYAGFEKAFALDGFREPTLLRVVGGNGDEMTAYVAVLPHPWASLTDQRGRFVLRELPAGTQKLYVWHETLGVLARELRVPSGSVVTVDFEFSAKK